MRDSIVGSILSLFLCHCAHAHDHASATYLGNEGVMVARADTKILFDAFYANSYGQYSLVPDDISAAMLAGDAPYDGVDAIFISHVHGDHFTAEPAIDYLRAQQDVHLYGSVQVVSAIKDAGVGKDDPLWTRVHGFEIAPEDKGEAFSIGDIKVDVVAIPHAGDRPTIQNFAWRVSLDEDTTVLHMGDAGPVPEHFDRHKDHFDAKKTHTAFPPYWFYSNEHGPAILTDIIKADQVIGVHVPSRFTGDGDAAREAAGGDLFTDPGETRSIGAKD